MFWFEKNACKKFDRVIAVSEKDKKMFLSLYNADNVVTIPTGVDVDYFKPMPDISIRKNSLVFCGSMDWLPNEDAMIYFIKDILPLIKKEIPDMSLTIVGRNPSSTLKKLVSNYSDIELTGWVEDTRPYIAQSSIAIVPIRIGGGTRMKIYEAMAMEKAVVSTSIGAEGLPVEDGKNIILADDPGNFGKNVAELLKNHRKRKEISKNSMIFVIENFAWKHVAEKFSNICCNTVKTLN